MRERDRAVRQIEHRFLHIQPALDGALTGYFELDPEGGATFLAGLETAAPPPSSGPNDVTRDALPADDLDEQAVVTVSRGRRSATGRPPALRRHPVGPGSPTGSGVASTGDPPVPR